MTEFNYYDQGNIQKLLTLLNPVAREVVEEMLKEMYT
jgi:hypothetical protein